ncbi:MAG TPA: PAS domain S-box protein [Vicinamibacteria bacterium]|nr:PAS domain S-box protein [Vicinamibacteria bacterium]
MGASVRVLHLEDSPTDSELVELALREAGMDWEVVRVETRDAFVAALEGGGYNIVVSDYSLPSFNGLQALREAKARRPEMAFLFFTATLGEERAVEALKAGATDFVAKERRDRLAPALLRALAETAERAARRQAEDALRSTKERLHHLVSSSPAVLYSLRVAGQTLVPDWVSENIEQLLGYAPAEVLKSEWWVDRVHAEDREPVLAQVQKLLQEGHVVREYRFRRKDGAYRWVRDEQKLLRDGEGNPLEVVASWSDVTERKQAELRLQEREEQYRLLFDSNPHPMWVFDAETLAFLAVNDAAVRQYGYTPAEFLGMTINDIRPPEEIPKLSAHLKGLLRMPPGSPSGWRHRTKDGSLIEVDISSDPITFQGRKAVLVLAHDVTEKRRLEAQLLQSQKMEAVGQLAGGVAHDFNNLLGVITGYTELMLKDLGVGHPGFRRAAEIQKAADRAGSLTRQLLAFSRKQVLVPEVLDLNTVLDDTEKMLRRLIGEDVQLVTVFASGLGLVKADPGQMEQVIINLAVNARDAMPRGGKLIIETANVDLDGSYTRLHPDVKPGSYVMLAVSDTGHGMDADTMSHIFEPFFTTKEEGKGTGLGLSTVFGIIKQSGGHVAVYSEVGQGTSFKVYLPRREEAGTLASAGAVRAEAPSTGSETILLVEDAEALRLLIAEILEVGGYRVLPGASPEQALATADGHDGPIHLLLTDVVMPRMSGRQVADRIKASRPTVKIMYMSGYTDEAISHHGALEPGTHFIQKPFTADALLRKVREVLEA